jgi:hypothetical protein
MNELLKKVGTCIKLANRTQGRPGFFEPSEVGSIRVSDEIFESLNRIFQPDIVICHRQSVWLKEFPLP